jgi:hypothetical protein
VFWNSVSGRSDGVSQLFCIIGHWPFVRPWPQHKISDAEAREIEPRALTHRHALWSPATKCADNGMEGLILDEGADRMGWSHHHVCVRVCVHSSAQRRKNMLPLPCVFGSLMSNFIVANDTYSVFDTSTQCSLQVKLRQPCRRSSRPAAHEC